MFPNLGTEYKTKIHITSAVLSALSLNLFLRQELIIHLKFTFGGFDHNKTV